MCNEEVSPCYFVSHTIVGAPKDYKRSQWIQSSSSPMLRKTLMDAPEPWQLGYQDGASPTFDGIVELHDHIMFYLIVILLGVGWMLISTMRQYSSSRTHLVHKYHNHGTTIELVWTITPAIVLLAIAPIEDS